MHGFGYLHSCKSMMRPHQRDYFVDISLGHFCNKAFHSEVCCGLLLLLIYKQIHIQFYPWSWSHPNNLVFSFDLHERDFDLLWRPRSRVPMNLIKKWKTEHIFSWYHYKFIQHERYMWIMFYLHPGFHSLLWRHRYCPPKDRVHRRKVPVHLLLQLPRNSPGTEVVR